MAKHSQSKKCSCTTGQRRLVLISPNLDVEFPEIFLFASQVGWNYYKDLGAMEVPFGKEEPTMSLEGFVNFLRSLFEFSRLTSLRATWLAEAKPIEQQLEKLIHAGLLVDMVSYGSDKLIDILYRRRIETWFQPILKISDDTIWGYECLLRGRTDEGEIIKPVDLIKWADRENLIFMLDRLSRETHIFNAANKIPNIDSKFVLINYLPSSIYRPEFCLRSTSKAASSANVPPENIIFEVVETERIDDIDHLVSILDYYRKSGFKVALDDVGSGFSSLNILADLHPDLIKIDLTLIQRARDSAIHRDVCQALVEIGRQRNVLVLAEGIETEEDKQFVTDIGADLMQGFLVGKPSMEINVQ